jgi:hypothetical protein
LTDETLTGETDETSTGETDETLTGEYHQFATVWTMRGQITQR